MSTRIRTFTGKLVDPFDLKPDDIDIVDIAHALSNQCRFTGHVKEFYSVGEHTLRLVELMKTEEQKRYALLHDAPEAYLIDLPAPIKNNSALGESFQLLEWQVKKRIYDKFKLDTRDEPTLVDLMDKRMCQIEKASLMVPEDVIPPTDLIHYTMLPGTAKRMFLKAFHELFTKRPEVAEC